MFGVLHSGFLYRRSRTESLDRRLMNPDGNSTLESVYKAGPEGGSYRGVWIHTVKDINIIDLYCERY